MKIMEHIDRKEFKKRLDRLFDWNTETPTSEILEALIDNDTDKINEIKSLKTAKNQKRDSYLTQWDAAQTQEEKDIVVGSVKIGE